MKANAPKPDQDLSDPALQRYVMRLGVDQFLRMALSFSDLFDGNLLTGLVFLAITQASVQHLNNPPQLNPDAQDGVFPDHLRRPVSVLGIAQFLGLPYETTRRHVMQLVERGYVTKMGSRGVVVPDEVMRRPDIDRLVAANFASVRTLVKGLQRGAGDILQP